MGRSSSSATRGPRDPSDLVKIARLIRAMRRRFDDAMPEKINALEAFRPCWQAVSVTAAKSLAGLS